MRNLVFAIGALGLLAPTGCAGLSSPGDVPHPKVWARGQYYASRSCAGCHAVTEHGASPNPHAPSFRALPYRFDTAQLKAALTAITRRGHGDMPPIYLTPAEIRDIAGYIESLQPSDETPSPSATTVSAVDVGREKAKAAGARGQLPMWL
jgi:mono/diheme cytochrome c family protein